MPRRIVKNGKQEQSSYVTDDWDMPPGPTDDSESHTALGEDSEMTLYARDNVLEELCTTFDNIDEPSTASGGNELLPVFGDLNELHNVFGKRDQLPTVSGDSYHPPNVVGKRYQPPIASGERHPPTASGERYQPPTASGERHPPTASGERYQPPTASGERYQPPTPSVERGVPSFILGNQNEPLKESSNIKKRFGTSGEKSESDNPFLRSSKSKIDSVHLSKHLEVANPRSKASREVPTDTTSSSLTKNPPLEYPDTDSSSESDDEVFEDVSDITELKKKISKAERLLGKAKDAMEAFNAIEEMGEALAKEVVDDDFISASRKLISSMRLHVQEINSMLKRLNQEDPSPKQNLGFAKSPHASWMDLTQLKYVIRHLAYTRGVIATAEEVKGALNRDIVIAKYNNYLDKKKVHSERIVGIVEELSERWVYAAQYLENSRDFVPTVKPGNVSAAKNVKELQNMFLGLKELARDVDMYITSGIFNFLQIKEKLCEYVTENTFLVHEMGKFLKLKMNLFGPIN